MSLFRETQHVGAYEVICADPPWLFDNYGSRGHGAAAAHYEGLTVEEICSMPVSELAAPNCALLLWCTAAHEVEGAHAEVIKAWGFRPVTRFAYWRKTYDVCICGHAATDHSPLTYGTGPKRELRNDSICDAGTPCACGHYTPKPYTGCGSYTRQSMESCWLGIKGAMPIKDRNIRDEIVAQVEGHSAKPLAFWGLARRAWPRARGKLELFCRGKPQPLWRGWGNECVGGTDVFGPEIGQEWPRALAPAPAQQQAELWRAS